MATKSGSGKSKAAKAAPVPVPAPEPVPVPVPVPVPDRVRSPITSITASQSPADPRRTRHVSIVEALREPARVFHLEISKPSPSVPIPADELAGLARLPELAQLESLRLAFTELATLPPLAGLRALRRLVLNGNTFTALPDGVAALEALEDLSLSSNPRLDLTGALAALAALPRLRRLSLGDRTLARLPDEIAQLTRLESLVIDFAVPDAITDAITKLPALRILNLRVSNDKGLPALLKRVAGIKSLRVLWLGGSHASEALPEEIGALTQLERLHIASLPMAALPAAITRLTKLELVDISGSKIKGPARKKAEALVPTAKFYWDGKGVPPDEPTEPPLEVRRVPA
jgi:Leucine-rich repeat (LRR) protein